MFSRIDFLTMNDNYNFPGFVRGKAFIFADNHNNNNNRIRIPLMHALSGKTTNNAEQ